MSPALVRLLPAVLGLLLVATGCTGAASPSVTRASDPVGFTGGTSLPDPYAMPATSLTDTSGRPYNLATSPSKPVTLLFFGYTHCPDVCTSVLSDVAVALQRLDPATRDQLQVVFVTTDPARDDERRVRAYLDRFDPAFVGLTGDLTTIKSVAERVGVSIEGRQQLPSGGYDVGHSAQVIGFDHTAGVVVWTTGTSVADYKHDVALLVDQAR